MVVADQDHVSGAQDIQSLFRIEDRIIAAESLVELAKIFAAAVRILGADFAFHSGQRVELRCAAAESQIDRGCHSQFSVLSSQLALLDFRGSASLCSKLRCGACATSWETPCRIIRRRI